MWIGCSRFEDLFRAQSGERSFQTILAGKLRAGKFPELHGVRSCAGSVPFTFPAYSRSLFSENIPAPNLPARIMSLPTEHTEYTELRCRVSVFSVCSVGHRFEDLFRALRALRGQPVWGLRRAIATADGPLNTADPFGRKIEGRKISGIPRIQILRRLRRVHVPRNPPVALLRKFSCPKFSCQDLSIPRAPCSSPPLLDWGLLIADPCPRLAGLQTKRAGDEPELPTKISPLVKSISGSIARLA